MSDVAEFLKARLDEDEAAARHTSPAPWQATPLATYVDDANGVRVAGVAFTEDGRHIARHDPARVLRDVAAKRAITELFRLDFNEDGEPILLGGYGEAYWDVLHALASVYSNHPDYDDAWAPSPLSSLPGD
jgi:hypothetical protein